MENNKNCSTCTHKSMCKVLSELKNSGSMTKAIVGDIVLNIKVVEQLAYCSNYQYSSISDEEGLRASGPYEEGYSLSDLQSAYEEKDSLSNYKVDKEEESLLLQFMQALWEFTESLPCPDGVIMHPDLYNELISDIRAEGKRLKVYLNADNTVLTCPLGKMHIRRDKSMDKPQIAFIKERKSMDE